jgi:hypothetical protein
VTEPRIATFARLANGNIEPQRVIEGQATKLGRTMHGIAVDPVRDEIFVTNPLASAVLVFQGADNGDAPPLRIIQGPKTGLIYPQALTLDTAHNEILVSDPGSSAVFVFARTTNGDVAPLRVIRGPKTRLHAPYELAVDPVRNLLVVGVNGVASGRLDSSALYIFDRTADGDVAPRAIIAGPRTGLRHVFGVAVYGGQILADSEGGDANRPYHGVSPRPAALLLKMLAAGVQEGAPPPRQVSQDPSIISLPMPWDSRNAGFMGVWDLTDRGDVAPHFILRGPSTGLLSPGSLALDPWHQSVIIEDSPTNTVYTYHLPELFKSEPAASGRHP